eukprot:3288323-Ditylum_brightwellii.AAC.1
MLSCVQPWSTKGQIGGADMGLIDVLRNPVTFLSKEEAAIYINQADNLVCEKQAKMVEEVVWQLFEAIEG